LGKVEERWNVPPERGRVGVVLTGLLTRVGQALSTFGIGVAEEIWRRVRVLRPRSIRTARIEGMMKAVMLQIRFGDECFAFE